MAFSGEQVGDKKVGDDICLDRCWCSFHQTPPRRDFWQPPFPKLTAFRQIREAPRRLFFFLRLLNLKCLQIKDHFSANPGVPSGSPHHEQYTVGASPFTPARGSRVVSRARLLQIKPLCTFVCGLFFELEGLISLSK